MKVGKDACKSNDDVWEKSRRNVRVFCPDGAANEQLVGRLITPTAFPKMQFVMRCAAHDIQNVINVAWAVDAEAQPIMKAIVRERGGDVVALLVKVRSELPLPGERSG